MIAEADVILEKAHGCFMVPVLNNNDINLAIIHIGCN